jgi:hypothetical protein
LCVLQIIQEYAPGPDCSGLFCAQAKSARRVNAVPLFHCYSLLFAEAQSRKAAQIGPYSEVSLSFHCY